MKKIYNLLIIILLGSSIYCFFNLVISFIEQKSVENEAVLVNKVYDVSPYVTKKQLINGYRVKYNNNDIVGVLNIDGVISNELVVQGNDNSYYLSHLINKKYSVVGSTFLDYRVNVNSKQLNIYGHNSTKYNVVFKKLVKYLDNSFFKKNKYISFMNENNEFNYEIFSVYVTNNDEHLKVDFKNKSLWSKHFNKLKNNSLYKTYVDIDSNDDILILQTCVFGRSDGSLLVICAKKI